MNDSDPSRVEFIGGPCDGAEAPVLVDGYSEYLEMEAEGEDVKHYYILSTLDNGSTPLGYKYIGKSLPWRKK